MSNYVKVQTRARWHKGDIGRVYLPINGGLLNLFIVLRFYVAEQKKISQLNIFINYAKIKYCIKTLNFTDYFSKYLTKTSNF